MLVEKLICNARLNLVILHPFPTPSQLPQQTGAQWPIYTEVPRNKNIYLQKEGDGKREGEDWERSKERDRVSPTHQSFGQLRGGGSFTLFASFQPSSSPHTLCKPLSTGIIQPFISQQTKHVTPLILNPTSSHHPHLQAVQSKPFKVKHSYPWKEASRAKATEDIC